jgi:ABC-type Fe3+-hydroxamate transport system substrate-binding protein
MRARDALGHAVETPAPPRRIVSLVPSETESVVELVGVSRLVGRTEYCVEPAALVGSVPTVGGTKSIDVDAVLALEPDLVLANQEENARGPIEKLLASGANVHVSFPCGVLEALAYLRALAALLHVSPDAAPIAAVEREVERALLSARGGAGEPVRVFVPIWKEPWMTFDGRTFASDLLELVGATNVFSDRPRRYPLAADLGDAPALDAGAIGDRDTRYPRVTLDEARARAPELVLLPDEPYAFGEEDRVALEVAGVAPRAELVDGKDLFWYGTRLARSIPALARRVRSLSPP